MNYIILGAAGSGKDLVASLLPGTRIAFADALKNTCRLLRIHDIHGAHRYLLSLFDGKEPSDILDKLRYFEGFPVRQGKDRDILQCLGMWARESYADIWIDAVKRRISMLHGNIIVTDCRFANELAAFPDFHSIYVACPEILRRQRLNSRDGGYNEASLAHHAESQVSSLKALCKSKIVNNGTMEQLRSDVESVKAWVEFSKTN